MTDARDETVSYSYDSVGRLSGRVSSAGSETYEYDAAGLLTMSDGPLGVTSFGYDIRGRLVSVATPNGSVGYTYDLAGRRTSIATGNGTVRYVYGPDGSVSQSDWDGNISTIDTAPDGLVDSVARPNGIFTSFTYDAARRPNGVRHEGPDGLIAEYSYELDGNGNRLAVTSGDGVEEYTLDALGRLVEAAYPNGDNVSFEYDAAGNRTAVGMGATRTEYSYDSAGRLTSDGTRSYAYDAAGNVAAVGDTTLEWDALGRLVSLRDGDNSTSAYSYDSSGLRVSGSTGGVAENYLWDVAGTVPQPLTIGDADVLSFGPMTAIREPSGDTVYPLTDLLGSVRKVSDSSGQVIMSTDYGVFGSIRDGDSPPSGIGFTGQLMDSESLVYLQSRYLDGATGRFLSADTVQPNAPSTQGWNLYAYVANNPTTWTDPTGNSVLVEYGCQAASLAASASTVSCLLSNLNPESPNTNLGSAGIFGGATIAHAGALGILYGIEYEVPLLLTLAMSLPFVIIGIAFFVVGSVALWQSCRR